MASMLGKQPIFTIYAELESVTNLGRTPYGEPAVLEIPGRELGGNGGGGPTCLTRPIARD